MELFKTSENPCHLLIFLNCEFHFFYILLYIEQKIDRAWLTANLGYKNPKQFCSIFKPTRTLIAKAIGPEYSEFASWWAHFLKMFPILLKHFLLLRMSSILRRRCLPSSFSRLRCVRESISHARVGSLELTAAAMFRILSSCFRANRLHPLLMWEALPWCSLGLVGRRSPWHAAPALPGSLPHSRALPHNRTLGSFARCSSARLPHNCTPGGSDTRILCA